MFDLSEAILTLHQNGYDCLGTYGKTKKTYQYHFELGDIHINVYNYNNTKIKIDNINFNLDYNTMTVHVATYGVVDIHSLDELKQKVNEYRRVYKRMIETVKKLQIEKDFNE